MKHRKYFEQLNEEDKELLEELLKAEQEEHKYGNDEHFEVVLLIAVGTIIAMVIYKLLGVF
ncbi:MAG: hypothetical protein WBK95_10610 [Sulfurimonas sp.]